MPLCYALFCDKDSQYAAYVKPYRISTACTFRCKSKTLKIYTLNSSDFISWHGGMYVQNTIILKIQSHFSFKALQLYNYTNPKYITQCWQVVRSGPVDSSVVTVAGAGELLLGPLLLTHGGQQSLLGPHLLRPPLSLGQALQGRGLQGLPPGIRSGWREANIESVSSTSDTIAHPDIFSLKVSLTSVSRHLSSLSCSFFSISLAVRLGRPGSGPGVMAGLSWVLASSSTTCTIVWL